MDGKERRPSTEGVAGSLGHRKDGKAQKDNRKDSYYTLNLQINEPTYIFPTNKSLFVTFFQGNNHQGATLFGSNQLFLDTFLQRTRK